jgi:hypothetical protein
MRHLTRRRIVAIATVAGLVAAGSAFAFWTGSTGGSGAGTVGTPGAITLTGTIANGIAPGLTKSVSFTGANSSAAPIYVAKISLSSVAVDAGHSACAIADFSMADVTENAEVPGNATAFPFPSAGSLVFADTSANQDACKGASLTLTLAGS